METIALSLSKGSSSWAREDQPSSRKRHLLRPEKMTLSGIAKCEYGLGDGDQRLLADQKASYKRKKKYLNLGKLPPRVLAVKTSLWDCQGTACVSPSFSPCPCSRGPPCSCLLPACSLLLPPCLHQDPMFLRGLLICQLISSSAFSPPQILVFLSDSLTAPSLSLPACKLILSSSWVERVV